MKITFSYQANFDDLDNRFGAVLVRSISLTDGDHERTVLRTLSLNGHDSEPTSLKKLNGSGNSVVERSGSLRGSALQNLLSFKTPTAEMENEVFGRAMSFKNEDAVDQTPRSTDFHDVESHPEDGNQRCQAALRLQKVYKSFRTRRRLADCAVLAEQRWWKVLDFAELKHSSISFFDIDKNETALSRWSRARTRAAKVGKGLSKDKKARKLALQHWLEAIDPRHRYGHNLQFYYLTWLHCESKQPFFYWLDIGAGKEVNHERCPRSTLQHQCIKYLGPTERVQYEVVIENGKFIYKKSGEILDTTAGPKGIKWIFVLSASKTLFVGQKIKGTFQHSSFLAGGATLSAGRLIVDQGILKAIWPHSGHYLPTEENFQAFRSFLKEHNVDLANVKVKSTDKDKIRYNPEISSKRLLVRQKLREINDPRYWSMDPVSVEDECIFLASQPVLASESPEEEEGEVTVKKINIIGDNPPEAEMSQETKPSEAKTSAQVETDSRKDDCNAAENPAQVPRLTERLGSKITRDELRTRGDVEDEPTTEALSEIGSPNRPETPEDGYETAEESFLTEEDFMVCKKNLFEEYGAEENEKPVPKEKIMRRIDSHKGMKSYQLAQQLSSKWSTGAGPRIGCMRDYPSELQARVLEETHLSPRSRGRSPGIKSHFSPKVLSPTAFSRQARTTRSPLAPSEIILSQKATS